MKSCEQIADVLLSQMQVFIYLVENVSCCHIYIKQEVQENMLYNVLIMVYCTMI